MFKRAKFTRTRMARLAIKAQRDYAAQRFSTEVGYMYTFLYFQFISVFFNRLEGSTPPECLQGNTRKCSGWPWWTYTLTSPIHLVARHGSPRESLQRSSPSRRCQTAMRACDLQRWVKCTATCGAIDTSLSQANGALLFLKPWGPEGDQPLININSFSIQVSDKRSTRPWKSHPWFWPRCLVESSFEVSDAK